MTAAAETIPNLTALPDSPFRGIEPFRYVDQPIFFAREEETHRLVRYVAIYRGVLFYGDSGSGKSSLVNAGFIPAVIAEGFTPDRLRVQPRPGEEIVVERISASPDGGPPYLPSNFVAGEEAATRTPLPAAELRRRLQNLPPERRPLLIFDQFEEFATLFEDVPRGGDAVRQAQEAQAAILKALVELLRDAALPVKLLFVFREDYLAKLNKLVALFPDLSDQYLRLTPPGTAALHDIIRGSFEKYPGHFGKEISEDLTRQLADAIKARSEGGKLNLSEVQIACLELWKSDDPHELFKRKGVQGLLEDYLSASLNNLPSGLSDPAVALLSCMVTPSGTRNIVSEYDLICQVKEDEGIAEERINAALHALVQETRLVRRERRYDTYFYDIVSEFLVPWISRQKAERLARIESRKLEEIERTKRRKAYRLAILSVLVAGLIALVAWIQLRSWDANVSRDRQVREANAAEEMAKQQLAAMEENLKTTEEKLKATEEWGRRTESALAAEREQRAASEKTVNDLNGRIADLTNRLNEVTNQKNAVAERLRLMQGPAEEVSVLRDALNNAKKNEDKLKTQLYQVQMELDRCKKGQTSR